jgi:hypothetical protein
VTKNSGTGTVAATHPASASTAFGASGLSRLFPTKATAFVTVTDNLGNHVASANVAITFTQSR